MRLQPLKRFVDPQRPITYGIVQAGEEVPGGVPYIRPIDMDGHDGVRDVAELKTTSQEIARQYARSAIRPGDIVVSIGPSFGKTMIVPEELAGANLTQGTARVAPAENIHERYLRWALQSSMAISHWEAAVGGATFRALNLEPLGRTPVPDWALTEQQRIARFLDAETARIDALITKKQRLADLINERFIETARASVTNDRSLQDPFRPESSELETGWRSVKLGRDLALGSGTTPLSGDERFYGPGTPWIVTGNLRDDEVVEVSVSLTPEAFKEYSALQIHPAGSLVVAMYGATVGRLGITAFPAAVNQACCVMHSGSEIDLRYLFLYLLVHREVLLERAVGAGQPNVSQEILRSLYIAAPARDAQAKIGERIFTLRRRTRASVVALDRQIALLREHRQALITAAVTGDLEIPGAVA